MVLHFMTFQDQWAPCTIPITMNNIVKKNMHDLSLQSSAHFQLHCPLK